jgi:DNA-binding MarR family transcriptional regulator
MTYTIDTLEKRGLIKRQPHPSDRRAVIIQITPPGRRLARSGTLRLDGITWGLEDLSDADAEALAILLSKVQPA